MVKPGELYTATARTAGAGSAFLSGTIVPSGLRRYIYYFEAHLPSGAIGTTRTQLVQNAATTAAVASGAVDFLQFNARGAQAWKPDHFSEQSLPLAMCEASCRTLLRSSHTTIAKIIFAEGV